MSFIKKILIDLYIRNSDESKEYSNITAIYNKDTYSFNIDNDFYKIKIMNKKIFFNKENNDSILDLLFINNSNTNGNYYIKELESNIDIKIKTTNFIVEDNLIDIEYNLWLQEEDTGTYNFKIIIKE